MTILAAKAVPDFIAPTIMPNSIIEENVRLSLSKCKKTVIK